MNHRIFERTLHPLVFRGVHPFECRDILNLLGFLIGKAWNLEVSAGLSRSQLLLNGLVGSALPILDVIRSFLRLGLFLLGNPLLIVSSETVFWAYLLLWVESLIAQNKNLDLKSGETTR